MKKRSVSLLLCLCLCLGLAVVPAAAAAPVEAVLDPVAYYGGPANCKMTAQQAEAFAEVIEEKMRSYTVCSAALFDFGNGIPVLYLYYDGYQISSGNGVWTYADGRAKELFDDTIFSGDTAIGPKGIIRTSDGSGAGSFELYQAVNGALSEDATLGYYTREPEEGGGYGDIAYACVKDREVTREEYFALVNSHMDRKDSWAGTGVEGAYGVSSAGRALAVLRSYVEFLQVQSAASSQELLALLPYSGDRGKCRMSPAQARAYADAIDALPEIGEYSDEWRATLVDVSGDGMPLLLTSEHEEDWEDHEGGYMGCDIWEYRDGRATRYDLYADGSNVDGFDILVARTNEGLVLEVEYTGGGAVSDYAGAQYYRVSNGALTLLHTFSIANDYTSADHGQVAEFLEEQKAKIGAKPVDFITIDGGPCTFFRVDTSSATVLASALRRYADLSATAYASAQTVELDGKAVEFQCYALKDENGNRTNYIKLRDLAMLINGTAAQFDVGWDGSVTITTGRAYTPNGSELSTPFSGDRAYTNSTAATKIDGRVADLSAIVLTDDAGGGYTYYKLRDLGQALGFNVGWSARRGVFLETHRPYDPAD